MYGNIAGADTYWTSRWGGSVWLSLDTTSKNQLLQSASDVINQLNYDSTPNEANTAGEKFPADEADDVPEWVIRATYELALCLYNASTQQVADGGNVRKAKIGTTETEFFGTIAPWVAAGIPCQSVWRILEPYRSDPAELTIIRRS